VANIDSLIFNFINTIPTRISFNKKDKVIDLFAQSHESYIESDNYHYVALSDIMNVVPRGVESIKTIFVFENYPVIESADEEEKNKINSKLITARDVLEYDLALLCGLENSSLKFIFKVNENKYNEKYINFVFYSLTSIVDHILQDINCNVNEIQLPKMNQLDKVLAWSKGGMDFSNTFNNIVTVFENIVNENSNSIAIVGMNRNFTYKELNEEINRWANYLIHVRKLKKQDVIALLLERSDDTIPIILGIVKAGMVYLNIDTKYPAPRIDYILKHSSSALVINDTIVKEFHSQKLSISSANPSIDIISQDLFYLIYTSGTTGNPKGCLLNHGNIYNLYLFMLKETEIMQMKPKVLQFSSWSFDPSTQEMMNALLTGGQLILVTEDERNDWHALTNRIAYTNAEIAYMSPSVLRSLTDFDYFIQTKKQLKFIVPAGEALTITPNIRRLIENDNVVLYNFYGPAETHVVTYKKIYRDSNDQFYPSIGVPIINTSIYILDNDGNLAPIGGIGEIYISGLSVGPGYLNNPIETNMKFIFHQSYGILYKTGDSALRDEFGEIHFLGRKDNQIKINGVRIETEEIEFVIKTHPQVINAAISIRRDNNEKFYLVGFYEGHLLPSVLEEYVKNILPSMFIPAQLIQIDKIPLNKHGKIDRSIINNIKIDLKNDLFTDEEPGTWLEEILLKTWKNLMNVGNSPISKKADFISQGGNSLKIIEFTSLINHQLNLKFKYRDVLAAKNLEGLYKKIISRGVYNDTILYRLTPDYDINKPNLILFPAYFGEGLYYLDFSSFVRSQFNVFTCDFYQQDESEKIDTDLFVKKLIKEVQNMGLENIIVGGASYGFRVAYRFSYYNPTKVKLLLNFDGSVYNDYLDEFNTIIELNDYELNLLQGEEKVKKYNDVQKIKTDGIRSRFQNDYYLGELNNITLINFYPKKSSVNLYQRSDISSTPYVDIIINGDHDTMLTSKDNYSIILKEIQKYTSQ
jgi:fengycin family lipopeptide synthetase D